MLSHFICTHNPTGALFLVLTYKPHPWKWRALGTLLSNSLLSRNLSLKPLDKNLFESCRLFICLFCNTLWFFSSNSCYFSQNLVPGQTDSQFIQRLGCWRTWEKARGVQPWWGPQIHSAVTRLLFSFLLPFPSVCNFNLKLPSHLKMFSGVPAQLGPLSYAPDFPVTRHRGRQSGVPWLIITLVRCRDRKAWSRLPCHLLALNSPRWHS